MKKIVGMGISAMGILLLVDPDFDLFEMSELIVYLFYTYWPLLLIVLGIYIQMNVPKKKRR